jgi:hypothetical protein
MGLRRAATVITVSVPVSVVESASARRLAPVDAAWCPRSSCVPGRDPRALDTATVRRRLQFAERETGTLARTAGRRPAGRPLVGDAVDVADSGPRRRDGDGGHGGDPEVESLVVTE